MDSETPTSVPLTGELTVAQLSVTNPVAVAAMGKVAIKDLGARYRQIVGLKPGSSSIRTEEMINEIVDRLIMGESVSAIMMDEHMPAPSTFWMWVGKDAALEELISKAQALGQRSLKDYQYDIAAGGVFSTGDPRRDELLVKVIDKNASQRNRAEFGDRQQIDVAHGVAYVLRSDADDFC